MQQPPLVEPRATLVPAAEVAGRLAGLQAGLSARGLEAALIVQNADLYYFSGTVQRSFLYVPAAGEATLFVRKLAERARLETPLTGIVELGIPRDLPGLVARALRRPAAPRGARARRAAGGRVPAPREALPGGGVRRRRPRHRAAARRQVGLGGRAHPRRRGHRRRGLRADPRHPARGPHRGRVRRPRRGAGAAPGPRRHHPHARLQPGDVLRPAAHGRQRHGGELSRHAAWPAPASARRSPRA